MKKSFVKRYKWVFVVVGIILLVLLAIYIFAPESDSVRFNLEMEGLY